ncbi:hypothetical protein ACPCBX_16190 [Streptomyces tuirus]|uniref:Uncharacterized protein n=1 Tax=Streptomyces tuirus TaxID=68278 RepID=A0A7G1NE04_9ACTN|nr:hypothetical protein [Streptomyces tuirus]BCL20971.1 hypothetical protein GCM10017668_28140 [Streptomyces tuirus]
MDDTAETGSRGGEVYGVGLAVGNVVGGRAGPGYAAPLYVGAGIALTAVAVMVVAAQRARFPQAADPVPAL